MALNIRIKMLKEISRELADRGVIKPNSGYIKFTSSPISINKEMLNPTEITTFSITFNFCNFRI
jgi:hypothetical protein